MISIIAAAVLAATNLVGDGSMITNEIYDTTAYSGYMSYTNVASRASDNWDTGDITITLDGLELVVNENAITTTIVTNAPVVTDNSTRIFGTDVWISDTEYHCEYTERTERTETTTVTEIKTLHFTWDGKPFTVKRERIIDTIVKRFKLTPSKWEETK